MQRARPCAWPICSRACCAGQLKCSARATDISRTERIMDRLGAATRRYLADLGDEQPLDDEDEGARGQEILSAVINLEHAGDIVANNLWSSRRGARGTAAASLRKSST